YFIVSAAPECGVPLRTVGGMGGNLRCARGKRCGEMASGSVKSGFNSLSLKYRRMPAVLSNPKNLNFIYHDTAGIHRTGEPLRRPQLPSAARGASAREGDFRLGCG